MSGLEEIRKSKATTLIQRIEFHEGKSNYREQIETRYCVTDIVEFMRLAHRSKRFDETRFAYEVQRLGRSRAERPNFRWYAERECWVYPKENMIASREVGLHYICQHCFDLLPYDVRQRFYSREKPFEVGNLFTLSGEKIPVFSKDIADGVSLSREKEKGYKERFVRWMRERNSKRAAADIKIPCPHCGKADLEQHRRLKDLLVCPLCWYKYKKAEALQGEFIRVKREVTAGWSHPRGY